MSTTKENVVTAFVLDFETGGLDCQKSAATQLAVHAVRLDTFEVIGEFCVYFQPYKKIETARPKKRVRSKYEINDEDGQDGELMEYSERALEYSGIEMDMLRTQGVGLKEGCEAFIQFVKDNTLTSSRNCKPILVGQNILFDMGFLTQILVFTGYWDEFAKLVRGNKDFWGNFQPYYVDTILFCQLALGHKKEITSWKLELEAEHLGIELDDAHDADADVTATREILRALTAKMRSQGQAEDVGSVLEPVKKVKTREHFKI